MARSSKRSAKRARVMRSRQGSGAAARQRYAEGSRACECGHCAQRRAEHLTNLFADEVARERPEPERLAVLFGIHPEEVPLDGLERPRSGLGLLRCLLRAMGKALIEEEDTRTRFLDSITEAEDPEEPRLPGVLRHTLLGPDPMLLTLDTYAGVALHHSEGAMRETQCHLQLIGTDGYRLTAIAFDPCRPQDVAGTPYRVPRRDSARPRGSLLVQVEAPEPITAEWLEAHPEYMKSIAALCVVSTAMTSPHQFRGSVQPPTPREVLALMAEAGQSSIKARRAEGQLHSAQHQISNLQRRIEGDLAQIQTLRTALERRDARIERLTKAPLPAAHPAPPPAAAEEEGAVARESASVQTQQLEEQRHLVAQLTEQGKLQRREIYELQQQVEVLQLAARAAAGESLDATPGTAVPTPESLADLDAWGALVLTDRVVLHTRAIEMAAASNFANPGKVYGALRALAELYWPMCYRSAPELKARWDQRLAELGLDCKPVGSALRNSRLAPAYEVTHEGRRHVLDLHLRGNSSFDPRYGLRIYFCRDDARERLIVGALPTHLPNTASN